MDCKTFVKKMIDHGYKQIKPKGSRFFVDIKIVNTKDNIEDDRRENQEVKKIEEVELDF